jgi:hypothetical protein
LGEGETETRGLAARFLAYERGDSVERAEVAAAEMVCSKLRDSLGPVIGDSGVHAVIVRAVKITQAEFPFVRVTATPSQHECLAGLRESLDGNEPEQVAKALTALIANFLAVLDSLLGRELTRRLISSAWPDLDTR